MGAKNKKVLAPKSSNAKTKELTTAQIKKQARKAEIAAAKAQGDAAKNAASFNPVTEISTLAGSVPGVAIEYLKATDLTDEVRKAAADIMGEETPAVGAAALAEEGVHYLLAKDADNAVGFAAYHFAFEEGVTVLCLDWVAIAEPHRRKGVASGLLSAVVETAQATQMQGVRASIQASWTSAHPSRAFMTKAGFEMCMVQPVKSKTAIMSTIFSEEAKETLAVRAEQLKKEEKAADKRREQSAGGRQTSHDEPSANLF